MARSSFLALGRRMIRYRTIFSVLCVLCAQKFGEFFLRYDANWKPIAVHQLMSSPPTKMMDRWNMTNLGAGNRLALAAGLRDWCKVLCCTLFSNIRKILRIFTNLRKILRMLLIGVKIKQRTEIESLCRSSNLFKLN